MARLSQLLYVYGVLMPKMVLINLVHRIIYWLNPSFFNNKHDGSLTDDWMASNRFLKTVQRAMSFQAARETELNGDFINVDLVDLSNKSNVSLSKFMNVNRPLIINFGSCT